ncbi:MAG: hypothetical protein GXO89_16040 [Chlorobi bacterium]|nr:hypothetical protein [Chlorobiota bacterium]
MNTIGAPASSNVQSVFGIGSWTTFNDTKIEMAAIDAAEFDVIGPVGYVFPELTGNTNEVNNLSIDDVLLFETVNGKRGYIKVNNFDQKGDRMNIDVKVAN